MIDSKNQIQNIQLLVGQQAVEKRNHFISRLFFLLFIFYSAKAMCAERLDFNLEKQVGYAMNACAYPIRNVAAGKSAAEAVSMSDYLKFKSNYSEAKKMKPDIEAYDGVVYGKKVNEVLPRCIEIMTAYEKGEGAADLPLSKNCINNVGARLKPILPGGSYHQRLSVVWFARKDLESARYRMYLNPEGFKSAGVTCDANDQFKKEFNTIKEQFEQAEKQVLEWEKERGVEFFRVEGGDKIIFKKDGKVLSATESNRI